MRITIESTSQVVRLNGVEARVWQGTTVPKRGRGIPVQCFITRVAVERTEDATEFESELQEHAAPSVAWPLRMVL